MGDRDVDTSRLLAELKTRLAAGEIDPDQVRELLEASGEPGGRTSRLSLILYFIGGGIVFLGLIFLIAQQWNHFGSFMRIFVTLGSAIAAFMAGVLLVNQERLGAAGAAFFLISALLLPLGLIVTYDEAGVTVDHIEVALQIMAVLSAVFVGAFLIFRRTVLLVFGVLFTTWLVLVLTNYIVGPLPIFDRWEFINYRIFAFGLSYLFLGHALADGPHRALTGWLYGFGLIGLLGAGLALGGWRPEQNAFWELIYPGLVFGVILLSVRLSSPTFLVFGSLALGAYLTKITAEYFSDSLGWPFALVLMGLMLMAVAYLALHLKRRYIS